MANPFGDIAAIAGPKRASFIQACTDRETLKEAEAQRRADAEQHAAEQAAAALAAFLALAGGDQPAAVVLRELSLFLAKPATGFERYPGEFMFAHQMQAAKEAVSRILLPWGIVLVDSRAFSWYLVPCSLAPEPPSEPVFAQINGSLLAARIKPWLDRRTAYFADKLKKELKNYQLGARYYVQCYDSDQIAVGTINEQLTQAGAGFTAAYEAYRERDTRDNEDYDRHRIVFSETA